MISAGEHSWRAVWEKKGRAAAERARYTSGDLFAAEGFDAVFSYGVFVYFPDRDSALVEN